MINLFGAHITSLSIHRVGNKINNEPIFLSEETYKADDELTPLLKPSARIVRFHHKSWKKWDLSIDSPDVLESQVLLLSDLLERLVKSDQYILHQIDEIVSKITAISGSEIHKDVADLFMVLSQRENFWLGLTSPHLYSLLLHYGLFGRVEICPDSLWVLASFLAFLDVFWGGRVEKRLKKKILHFRFFSVIYVN